ncbi:glycosyltransferase [Cellulomonas endophytica]|uniref:glycosyltransferase n=1 Tax=Cellulomonas endophytica TaxID=2494735 RepID=UPI0010121E35|nr:glycosyltransferase [Cellulomonas endophytica]
MSPHLRVALLNNYSMRYALRKYERGIYPGQHLWGHPLHGSPRQTAWTIPRWSIAAHLTNAPPGAEFLRKAVMRTLGDVAAAAWVLLHLAEVDVVYAADGGSFAALAALRRLHLFPRPVVAIVHHVPTSRWQRWTLRGLDGCVFLSEHVRERCAAFLPAAQPQVTLPWGPDLHSRIYAETAPHAERVDFVSAGKTNRDYRALRAVARRDRLTGYIFEASTTTAFRDGEETRTEYSPPYPEIVARVKSAAAVVVPLRRGEVLAGMTEVADAIAADVPVVTTASVAFPYDLEAVRAGVVVPPGDEDALSEALARCRRGEAGTAKHLEPDYNMERFSTGLDAFLTSVADRTAAPALTTTA